MQDVTGVLGGFRGVRADLLVALKKRQSLSAHELGAQFGLTANALRRHLKVLEEDGLVAFAREAQGVGAPVFRYYLSPAGEALFPSSYVESLSAALDLVRKEIGDDAVTGVLEAEWSRLVEDAGPVLRQLPLSERVALLAELLTSKGYMAESVHSERVVPEGPQAQHGSALMGLRIHNCALRDIVSRFPEACAVEAKYVAVLLDAPLVRHRHRQDGCGRCEYGIVDVDAVREPVVQDPIACEQEQA